MFNQPIDTLKRLKQLSTYIITNYLWTKINVKFYKNLAFFETSIQIQLCKNISDFAFFYHFYVQELYLLLLRTFV